ncbi:hypothetical protein CLV88_11786 [Shimia abyssi]|uniref:HD domain-containing protein n=1 Tax=Shimia abyssi TaxID=1662395 RepID=A0A2P8F761_9RHOB|nr:hypothetical protein CLV88_11786 [Shimia abyssi]
MTSILDRDLAVLLGAALVHDLGDEAKAEHNKQRVCHSKHGGSSVLFQGRVLSRYCKKGATRCWI